MKTPEVRRSPTDSGGVGHAIPHLHFQDSLSPQPSRSDSVFNMILTMDLILDKRNETRQSQTVVN